MSRSSPSRNTAPPAHQTRAKRHESSIRSSGGTRNAVERSWRTREGEGGRRKEGRQGEPWVQELLLKKEGHRNRGERQALANSRQAQSSRWQDEVINFHLRAHMQHRCCCCCCCGCDCGTCFRSKRSVLGVRYSLGSRYDFRMQSLKRLSHSFSHSYTQIVRVLMLTARCTTQVVART